MQKLTRSGEFTTKVLQSSMWMQERVIAPLNALKEKKSMKMMKDERGDVPGWVLVVLMTTGFGYGNLDYCSAATICNTQEFTRCHERHSISDSM